MTVAVTHNNKGLQAHSTAQPEAGQENSEAAAVGTMQGRRDAGWQDKTFPPRLQLLLRLRLPWSVCATLLMVCLAAGWLTPLKTPWLSNKGALHPGSNCLTLSTARWFLPHCCLCTAAGPAAACTPRTAHHTHLEACALSCAGLLLHGHDLHDLVLEGRAEEVLDNLVLLDGHGKQVNGLQGLDLALLGSVETDRAAR